MDLHRVDGMNRGLLENYFPETIQSDESTPVEQDIDILAGKYLHRIGQNLSQCSFIQFVPVYRVMIRRIVLVDYSVDCVESQIRHGRKDFPSHLRD